MKTQWKAFEWITFADTFSPQLQPGPGMNDAQLIQRYVLAAHFYATNGDSWTNKSGWLGGTHECDWFGITCSTGTTSVGIISLNNNHLTGSISTQLGLLSNLRKFCLRQSQSVGL
jgi:hypothetical protein